MHGRRVPGSGRENIFRRPVGVRTGEPRRRDPVDGDLTSVVEDAQNGKGGGRRASHEEEYKRGKEVEVSGWGVHGSPPVQYARRLHEVGAPVGRYRVRPLAVRAHRPSSSFLPRLLLGISRISSGARRARPLSCSCQIDRASLLSLSLSLSTCRSLTLYRHGLSTLSTTSNVGIDQNITGQEDGRVYGVERTGAIDGPVHEFRATVIVFEVRAAVRGGNVTEEQ